MALDDLSGKGESGSQIQSMEEVGSVLIRVNQIVSIAGLDSPRIEEAKGMLQKVVDFLNANHIDGDAGQEKMDAVVTSLIQKIYPAHPGSIDYPHE